MMDEHFTRTFAGTFRVTAIAMKDGVHERFLTGKPDIPEIVTTTIFFEQNV